MTSIYLSEFQELVQKMRKHKDIDTYISTEIAHKEISQIYHFLYPHIENAFKEREYTYYTYNVFNLREFHSLENGKVYSLYRDLLQSTYIPNDIQSVLQRNTKYYLHYTFDVEGRTIHLYFAIFDRGDENENEDENDIIRHYRTLLEYDGYISTILLVLHLLSMFTNKNEEKHGNSKTIQDSTYICSNTLHCFLSLTDFTKHTPNPVTPDKKGDETSNIVFGSEHVNSAVTYGCIENNGILIYRKEEWLKVFIHECIHALGLDFSRVDITKYKNRLLQEFHVESKMNFYEAYTETTANILYIAITSYLDTQNRAITKTRGKGKTKLYINKKEDTNYENYLSLCHQNTYITTLYTMFQVAKILNSMNMNYKDILVRMSGKSAKLKENTNVFAYYFLRSMLLFNIDKFIQWMRKYNKDYFSFPDLIPSDKKMNELVDIMIEGGYNRYFIEYISYFIEHIQKQETRQSKIPSLYSTMRMTLL